MHLSIRENQNCVKLEGNKFFKSAFVRKVVTKMVLVLQTRVMFYISD